MNKGQILVFCINELSQKRRPGFYLLYFPSRGYAVSKNKYVVHYFKIADLSTISHPPVMVSAGTFDMIYSLQ